MNIKSHNKLMEKPAILCEEKVTYCYTLYTLNKYFGYRDEFKQEAIGVSVLKV